MFRKMLLAGLCCVLFVVRAMAQTAPALVDYSIYTPTGVAGTSYIGASSTDSAGNTYVAGTYPNDVDGYYYLNGFFVAKYNALGQQMYNTTFGAANFPYFSGTINSVAVDKNGKVYLAGLVSGAYGGGLSAVNGYQPGAGSPYNNAFFCVVSADGTTITYGTYFGANTTATSVAVDFSGNAYVVGNYPGEYTFDFLPVTPGAPDPNPIPGLVYTAFIAKFNPQLTGAASLLYSTFIPANQAYGVAVDATGNAYVTGNTESYTTSAGAYRYNGRKPNNDVFVTKVNPTGTAFVYSALLGPGSGNAIAVDSASNAYVAGTVNEDDYPTTPGAYQTSYPSGFVTELKADFTTLVSSTLLGGPEDSYVSGSTSVVPTHIALPAGCTAPCPVYVAGYTNGSDLPLLNQVQGYVPGSTYSGFYLELAGGLGSLLQSSYFASGASLDTYQGFPGLGLDSANNIYLVGDARPSQLPTTRTPAGPTGEGFLARIIAASGAKLAASPSSVSFPTQQVVGVSTAQQGLTQPIVQLENLGNEAATISSITVAPANVFSQTNNCNGSIPAGGYCTLTLSFRPSVASTTATPQTGTITVASNASVNPTIQLSGTGRNDRYITSSCGGVTPCPGLSFADTIIGASAPAQIVTLTNIGNTAVPFSQIASVQPPGNTQPDADYRVLTNCSLSGGGLAPGRSCEVSAQFGPTQVGLRSGTIAIASTGTTTNPLSLAASGTGLLSPNASSLVLLDKTLNFGTKTLGATSGALTVMLFNNGSAPVTVFAPTVATTGDATGVNDYTIASNTCGQVLPQASCVIGMTFSPTATGTRVGTLTIPNSSSSTSLTSSLTGIGVLQAQTLEFTPNSFVFEDRVVGSSSGLLGVSVINVGAAPVSIDRVTVTGMYQITADTCSQTTLAARPLSGTIPTCIVTVIFSPTATGLQTGTITVVDSEGRQSAFSLAGTGVAQNGSVLVSPGGLNFGVEPVGLSSTKQSFTVSNTGNSPITVSALTTTGDYTVTPNPALPWVIQGGAPCCYYAGIEFTPSKVANPDNGTLTLTTSVGSRTVSMAGIGESATKALILTPSGTAGLNFGNIEVGGTVTSQGYYFVNVYNVGTETVTFTTAPALGGTNAGDFSIYRNNCAATLASGSSCSIYLSFSPTVAGTRLAVLTLTDDASTGSGVQTVSLRGTGTAAVPPYTLFPNTLTFVPQPITTASGGANITFINNGSAPVTISSVTFQPSVNFTRAQNYYGDCNEIAAPANGGRCAVLVLFTPTTAGSINATMTMTDSKGNNYVAQLAGYAAPEHNFISASPTVLNFAPLPQGSAPSPVQSFTITNSGNLPVSIGPVTTGGNVIFGSSTTGAFKITQDGCSNQTIRASGNTCSLQLELIPAAATPIGNQAATIKVPATFADKTTATLTLTINGTVVAPINSAELSPTVLTFPDQAVNLAPSLAGGDPTQSITLTNKSNLPLTVGQLTEGDTIIYNFATHAVTGGQFSLWLPPATYGGNGDGCSTRTLNPGASCNVQLAFLPTVAGSQVHGNLSFPVTFTNGKTANYTANYYGNALAAKNSLQISPSAANFGSEVVGQTTGYIGFQVTNNGNQPVTFGTSTLASTPAGNFARSGFDYNSCSGTTLAVGASCTFNINFTPPTTDTIPASGSLAVNGTLTIADGAATGGPHVISLTGTALAASKTISVSQTTVNFGNRAVGLGGNPQAVYLTNESNTPVSGFTYTLGGTNSTDFTLQANTCGATILTTGYTQGATCALLVNFTPATASLGARTATVTVSFTGSGSPITIALNGTGVPPAPSATLFPTTLSYPLQAVGLKSVGQYFTVNNTGTANLTFSNVSSTNTTEFPVTSNGCSGNTIAPGKSCAIAASFSPTAAGTRAGSIQVFDNAPGSPHTVSLTGSGEVVPLVSLSSSSLAFGNEDYGTASATQTVTVTNPGAAALTIGSLASAGADPADFPETTTCGTTLAAKATCTITMKFLPKGVGSRTASIVVTDNPYNQAGSTQTIALTGTGVGVPTAGAAPGTLAFGTQAVGAVTAAKSVTVTNSGTAALAIASVKLGGTNAADFTATSGCPASLAVGANCTITVTFKPAAAGARSGSLVITDNSGLVAGATQTVTLTGTGG